MGNMQLLYNQPQPKYVGLDSGAVTEGTLVAAVAGKRIRVLAWYCAPIAASTLEFLSGTTALTGAMSLSASIGYGDSADFGLFETEPGEALAWTVGASARGYLVYQLV